MNKIYEKDLSGIKEVSYDDDGLTLSHSEGVLGFSFYHSQDCCEHVYADYSVFKYYIEEIQDKVKEIKHVDIIGVKDMGFLVNLYYSWGSAIKVFVPCYNDQNGYYSDDLHFTITEYFTISGQEKKTTLDISDYVEDQIC